MMRNKLPQALPCLQITGLAAQIAEKYGLRPVPYSALRRVYDTRFPLPVQTRSPNGQMWVDRYYIAWQLGSGPVRYGYLTRRHIFEELTAYRAAARLRGTPVLLPADIGAAFSSTLRQMRLREGRTTAAAEVHHIVPLADSGTHAWDNLRALCKRCHSRITATEGGRWRK